MKLLIFSNSLELYNKTKHVCSEYRELKTVNEMSGMMRECTQNYKSFLVFFLLSYGKEKYGLYENTLVRQLRKEGCILERKYGY